jgi:hypothetical protein
MVPKKIGFKRIHRYLINALHTCIENDETSDIILTTNIYGLQVFSIFFGISWLLTLVINYARFKDIEGSQLEWHHSRQIFTAWINILFYLINIAVFGIFGKLYEVLIIIFIILNNLMIFWNAYMIFIGYLNIRSMYLKAIEN